MKVFVATDIRLTSYNGRLYVVEAVSTIFRHYVTNFGKLVVCCRVVPAEEPGKREDVTDMIEEVIPVENLLDTFTGRAAKKMTLRLQECDLVVGRMHSFLGNTAFDCARRLGKPFFAEVMGDAWDAFWNHSLVGKMIAPYMFLKTKQVVKNADYALYVTSEYLQSRYPCKNPSVGVSDVCIGSLDPQVLEKRLERIRNRKTDEISLITTAAVNVRYKGQEYVIRAIPALNRAGIRVKYTLVGGGDPSRLQQLAEKCGVADQVVFTGQQSHSEVFALLDEADIYIQPSLQEGLPRAVVEAMSRGCPAVGARTAGIPELIAPECVVRRKSVSDIAQTIIKIANAEKMTALANENFENARNFEDSVLRQKRESYYEKMAEDLYAHKNQ